MAGPELIVGGLVLPLEACVRFSQVYERLSSGGVDRMADGTADAWELWGGKLRTTVTATGWAPGAFGSLDPVTPYLVECAQPRRLEAASPSIMLPAARRSGGVYAPRGYAVLSGRLSPTGVSIAVDAATLDAVPGASGYVVTYFPAFMAHVRIPSENLDSASGEFTFQLVAEEV